MPRPRSLTSQPTRRPGRAGDSSPLLTTAHRMVSQIEELVTEMAALREDNDALRVELRDAVSMMERATLALDGAGPHTGRRRRAAAGSRPAKAGRRARAEGGRRAGRGRATPEAVTPQVVMAAAGKLGSATAAQIAAEISRNGVPVSGRAVRFLAERAGARITVGDDGQRRYQF